MFQGDSDYAHSPTHIRFDADEVSHDATTYAVAPPPPAYTVRVLLVRFRNRRSTKPTARQGLLLE